MKSMIVGGAVWSILLVSAAAGAQLLDFEDLALTAQLRVPDLPWVSDGVAIDGQEFFWLPSGSTVDGYAEVQNTGLAGGSGNEVWINNMNLDFGLTAPTPYVEFLFGEYGGNLNAEINGHFESFENMIEIDGKNFGPAIVNVVDLTGDAHGGGTGRVEVTGPVDSFSIGGQEFVIDNVLIPEPGTLVLLILAILGVLATRRRDR